MKRLLLMPALALSVLVATPAAGAETLHASFKGQFAEAEFSSLDPSGCVVTDVFIFAVDGRVKETGHPVVTSSAASLSSSSSTARAWRCSMSQPSPRWRKTSSDR